MTFRAFVGISLFVVTGAAQAPRPRMQAIYRKPAARAASEELTQKRASAILAQQELDKLLVQQKGAAAPSAPEVAAAEAKVAATTSEAKRAASAVLAEPDSQLAPAVQVKQLEDAANQIKVQASIDANSSIRLNQGMTLLASLLALGGGIAGARRKSMLASILSLCAGTAGGTPKLLGFDQSVEFYQQLYSGANSLASDIRLDLAVTVPDYNGYVRRLNVLNAHDGPGAEKSREAALALMNELLAAKGPHKD